jgi:hypothetical protein
MMLAIQINFLSYKTEAGKNREGSKRKREKERDREELINGVRKRA